MIKITISELLDSALRDIGAIDGIQASALVSNDGFMMVSDINNSSVDAKTIGAVVAMLTRSAIHTAKELNKGEIEYVLVNTKYGHVIIIKVDSNTILTVLTDTNTNISFTIEEMKKACEKIKSIFARV